MARISILFFSLLFTLSAFSQTVDDTSARRQPDTLRNINAADTLRRDTTVIQNPLQDSVSKRPPVSQATWQLIDSLPWQNQILAHHPYFGFGAALPPAATSPLHQHKGKELLFYVLVGFVLLFAILKGLFPKYFNDLFRLFFRTTLKQRQIREQLVQTPLPSLLMNGFFVITGGLYIDLVLLHYQFISEENFWLYFLYAALGLCVVYTVKFIGLKILGWIFNYNAAASSYIFIVFVINKVMGIFLLPFLFLLAFAPEPGYSAALLLSWIGLGCLFIYRFMLTYAAIRNQVKFNIFHFFLYLCAFEIAPLLLIYNLLLTFFR